MKISDIKNWLFKDGRDALDKRLDSMDEGRLRYLAKEYKIEFDSAASKPTVAALVKAALEKEAAQGAQGAQGGGNRIPLSESVKGEVFKYRCKTRCTYKGKLVREGDIIFLPEEQELSHFELVKDKEE